MLGRGGFGAVFMATKSFERVDYAVKKVVLCEGGNVNNRTLHVLREVRVFAKFDQLDSQLTSQLDTQSLVSRTGILEPIPDVVLWRRAD